LVIDPSNPAVAVLQHAGVPMHRLRWELERTLGEPPGGARPREVALESTPGEAALVAAADRQAAQLKHEYIGTEHLLLAVIAQEASPTTMLLAVHGVTQETATASLHAILAPPV
jgi:ATP-dependent Clp protease ATP-binding subunit ClpA